MVRKASQDSRPPPKHEFVYDLSESLKSVTKEWECTHLDPMTDKAQHGTIPGVYEVDGYIMTNWEKLGCYVGTINMGGKFSPHAPRFRPATGIGVVSSPTRYNPW